jgi:ATP-binding cassette subfamily F protein 3
LNGHERRIEDLQKRIAGIDRLLADPSLYEKQPERAQSLARERGELAKALSAAEEEWFQASAAYEEAASASA